MYTNFDSRHLFSLFETLVLITGADSVEFSAFTIDNDSSTNQIYLSDWNADPPSDEDPATSSATARLQFCEHLSRNCVSDSLMTCKSVDVDAIVDELQQPQYADIFRQLYGHAPPYKYTNSFALREFDIDVQRYTEPYVKFTSRKSEHVFACVVRDTDFSKEDSADEEEHLVPYYVSKMYNVHRGLHARRYVFAEYVDVVMAEQSAKAYIRPDFNIELYYLQLRKYHPYAGESGTDPVCRLNRKRLDEKQLIRLCTIILTSSYFKSKILSIRRFIHDGCPAKEVGFKTREAREALVGVPLRFFEYVVKCYAYMPDGSQKKIFISRAYNPNEVFVYTKSPRDKKLYLEVLLTDVSIVHERYHFHKIEI